jgi:hypothetical protein
LIRKCMFVKFLRKCENLTKMSTFSRNVTKFRFA